MVAVRWIPVGRVIVRPGSQIDISAGGVLCSPAWPELAVD